MRSILIALVCCIAVVNSASLCDKYATAKGVTGKALLETVVGTVFPWLTNTTAPTTKYFDGSLPWKTPVTNYTDPANTNATNGLVQKLVQFFGAPTVLDCTDGSVPAYTGRSMQAAHAGLPIGNTAFVYFNGRLLDALKSLGVEDADLTTIGGVLEGTRSAICNQPDCGNKPANTASICDRYSYAAMLPSQDLVSAIVNGVFTNVTSANSPLKKFFDGSLGNTNFLTNTAAATTLFRHLVEFFGQSAVLGCTASNFPTYDGRTLKASHSFLPITEADFNLFNRVLLDVATSLQVSATDGAAVASVLEGTKADVCTNCTSTTPTNAPTPAPTTAPTSSASTLLYSVCAVFVAVALYLF